MRLLRNHEIRRFIGLMLLISALSTVSAFLISRTTGWMVLATVLALCVCSLVFTLWRYRQLDKLSGYLRRISGGEYELDIRDHEEGELSILTSDIYKVTSMLAEYNEQLKKEKRQLADAMADISHQLKTPLTSMTVMADLLSDERLPADKRKEFTGRIRTQLERIQWLLSSLLKLSRLDAGVIHFRNEPVNVTALIRKASAPLLIPIELKEQTLELSGAEGVTFSGDEGWSTEAIVNILKNCVEHTQIGGKLRIEWEGNPIFTEIRIADDGEGIDPEDVPHIFTRFFRGHNAGDDSVGIGLAMARSIIQSQNGDISVTSAKGQGTLFRIRFSKLIV